MKYNKLVALSVATALAAGALALAGCSSKTAEPTPATSELSGTINVAGSDTMVNLSQAWAEKFQEENPDVSVTVKGGGSGNGIAALINKTIDFANSSRPIKDEEKTQAEAASVSVVGTEVARDGVVVIVNSANTVSALTKDQLKDIYSGKVTNWKEVGGPDKAIVLLGRDSSSGTYGFVKDEVLGKETEYAKSMRNLQSTQAIVDEVSKNADSIGYIGLGYENASIKPIAVDGTQASVETVLDGSYALSRGLEMYSDGEPDGVKKAYLEWILSDAGQAIVEEQGFVPLAK